MRRTQVLAVLAAALTAVEPGAAVRAALRRVGDELHVRGDVIDLGGIRRVLVVGGGKAGASMAAALEEILGDRLDGGVVVVKYGYLAPTRLVKVREAGHPLPDASGVEATRAMLEMASGLSDRDLVFCVISGGGSALMTLPVEGVSLGDLTTLTGLLLASGATINEINTVRACLDRVKGGGLARLLRPARVVSLILSDVVGNALDVIASGPTVARSASAADAWRVLERYGLLPRAPASVVAELGAQQGCGGSPVHPEHGPLRVDNVLVGSNAIAAEAAVAKAQELGFHGLLLSTFVEGEAREIARFHVGIARELLATGRPIARPACVVVGGESTVTLGEAHGQGGRNQEMALSAALGIEGLDNVIIACLATDGSDGPTDAAGALADGTTVARAWAAGLDPVRHLAGHDAYPLFARLGDLLVTGPTNTNVNDLTAVFAW
ncbi:MAG: glycerate kinase type-2 family protein [Acidobacteriota bacterium]